MRTSGAYSKLNMKILSWAKRQDLSRWPGDSAYVLQDVFTTHDGSWEPSSDVYGVPQWARDAYLKPWGDPEYFDDAGGDHHLFALVLGLDGKPIPGKGIMYWSTGIGKLSDSTYTAYQTSNTKDQSKWANIPIYNGFVPERGESGAWCWCPIGASDVLIGGGLPDNQHVSTFAVWAEMPREQAEPEPDPKPTMSLLKRILQALIVFLQSIVDHID